MGTAEEKLSTEGEEEEEGEEEGGGEKDAYQTKYMKRWSSMSVGRVTDLNIELSVAKASLAQVTSQLEKNGTYIEFLKAELEKVKEGEALELNVLKESLANAAQELEKKDEYPASIKAELAIVGVLKESLLNASKELEREEEQGEALREEVSSTRKELEKKDAQMEVLKVEVAKLKEVESKLAGNMFCLSKLRRELTRVKTSETHAMDLLAEGMKRIEELEAEGRRSKEYEMKLMDSFAAQTKQLEQTKISLEESKLEKKFLLRKLEKMGVSVDEDDYLNSPQSSAVDEEIETLKSELHLANETLSQCFKKEKLLLCEISSLKNEVKMSSEAEENSKKALDDLVVALKEVTTEGKEVKEKLELAEGEIEILKQVLRKTEDLYSEAKREADTDMNTCDRLRLEVEESLIAWNEKEAGFVECIKRAEEERDEAQESYNKAQDEIQKLRDVLKEALDESNVAKESAGIAKDENSHLKDVLAQKDDALNYISRENESLKISGVSAQENTTESKKKLKPQETTCKEHKEDKEVEKQKDEKESVKQKSGWKLLPSLSFMESRKHKDEDKLVDKLKKLDSSDNLLKDDNKEQEHKHNDDKELKLSCLNLPALKIPHKQKEFEDQKSLNLDSDKAENEETDLLKGSIFDIAKTPEAKKGHQHQRKKSSFSSIDFDEAMRSEYLDNLDGSHFDDVEDERNTRQKRALLRRFRDLIRMKSYYVHRKEPSIDKKDLISLDKLEHAPLEKKEQKGTPAAEKKVPSPPE